jgi:hypothetical protein
MGAVAVQPGADRLDHLRLAGQRRAAQPAQTLVERDIDRIEQAADLGVAAVEPGDALPQARPVHVARRPEVARLAAEGAELLPGRQGEGRAADRQLDHYRGQGLADAVEIGRRERAAGRADEHAAQPVQGRIGAVLVRLDVRLGMQGDGVAPGPVRPGAQGRELGGDALGQEHGRRLAQQLLHRLLHHGVGAAAAVDVGRQLRLGERRERGELVGHADRPMAADPARARRLQARAPCLVVGRALVGHGALAKHRSSG